MDNNTLQAVVIAYCAVAFPAMIAVFILMMRRRRR
jgi:hypothetical protein